MENFSINFGGIWLGMMIIVEALAIYALVYFIRCLLRPQKDKSAPIYMFDDAFDSGDVV